MTKTHRTLICVIAVPMVLALVIGARHKNSRSYAQQSVIHEPVAEAEDIDFLMHDMEQARQEAKAAYDRITDANRRTMFDGEDMRGWKP